MKKHIILFLWSIVLFACQFPLVNADKLSDKVLFTVQTKLYDLQVRELLKDLKHPWGMTWLQDDSMIISERNGSLWVLKNNVLYAVSGLPQNVYQGGQGGWLDLAYHPDNWIYLSYARQNKARSTTALVRFRLQKDRELFHVHSLETVFIAKPELSSSLHYGAPIAITPDGVVFLGMGERGQRDEAQDKTNDLGSVIRIAQDGSSSVYSYGHRNIQGMFYDAKTKMLFAHEHGPQGGDELNLVEQGKNYGWPVITYGKEYVSGRKIGEGTAKPGMEQPLYQWTPSPALSGLTRYYGTTFPDWNGDIFIGALKFQRIYRLRLRANAVDSSGPEEEFLTKKIGRIRSIRTGPDGNIYILSDEKRGRLIRLEKKR